jgi:hypothetical protein
VLEHNELAGVGVLGDKEQIEDSDRPLLLEPRQLVGDPPLEVRAAIEAHLHQLDRADFREVVHLKLESARLRPSGNHPEGVMSVQQDALKQALDARAATA